MHRFILVPNYMIFQLVLYPSLLFWACVLLIYGRRRMAVARYRMICLVLKTLRVCNFAKCEEKCMIQYRNYVLVWGNKYTNFLNSLDNLFGNSKHSHFFPKFCKMLEKFIMFIDNTLQWCLIIKIVIKHPSFHISSCYNWGIKSRGVIPQYCKSHNFWNFNDFTLGYTAKCATYVYRT